MKVLWFTNTPCGAAKKLNNKQPSGGWLTSLEEVLVQQSDIELSVCFYSEKDIKPFKYKKTNYFPVYRKNSDSKIWRYYNRLLNRSYNDKEEVPLLLSVINTVEPDIIHIHGTEENFGLIQQHTKIPAIISIQGILSPITLKYFSGIPFLAALWYEGIKPKIFLKSFRYKRNDFKKRSLREQTILSNVKHIIGRTDWDRRVTRILAPNSKYYIGNEILRSSFYQKQWSKNEFGKPLQLTTVMGSSLFKGIEMLIKVAEIIIQNNNINFNWIVVGLKPTDDIVIVFSKWLKIDLKTLHINFVGTKNENELVEILLKSDIYCQLSHIENSPNSLSEAMLVGLPVIATMVGGTSTLLIDQHEGILVQEGEPYSYAGAITELYENFYLSTKYATTARIKAIQRHNKCSIIEHLNATYKSVLQENCNDCK